MILYVFAGLPGTGKSALSRELARRCRAMHLRVDTIEQVLRESDALAEGSEGYRVACEVAADNLGLGNHVVADSVNPLRVTRETWRAVAERTGAVLVEIELLCSDAEEHRRRVESRATDVPGLRLPTWEEVRGREYEPWDRPRLLLDTAGQTVEESFDALMRMIEYGLKTAPVEMPRR